MNSETPQPNEAKKLEELLAAHKHKFEQLETADQEQKNNFEEVCTKLESFLGDQQKLQAALKLEKERNDRLEAAVKAGLHVTDDGQIAEDPTQKAQFGTFLRNHKEAGQIDIKRMRTDSDPDGGYLVRPQFLDKISERVFETSPVRQYAETITTDRNRVEFLLDADELGFEWAGENQPMAATANAELGLMAVDIHKIQMKPSMTTEQLEDSGLDVEGWLQGKLADRAARAEASAFVSGDGIKRPKGILAYNTHTTDTYTAGSLQKVVSGASGALTADAIIELQNALKEAYQPGAMWLMKRSTFGHVIRLKGADRYHFLGLQPTDRQGVVQLSLLGKQVVFADDMPALATGNLSIAYGDLGRGYLVVDRLGLNVLRDPYTKTGAVQYKTTKRVGGAVQNFEAIKLMEVE